MTRMLVLAAGCMQSAATSSMLVAFSFICLLKVEKVLEKEH
jgi:hypothetical protein